MKVALKKAMLVGTHYHDAGAVVELDPERAKRLIEFDHAEPVKEFEILPEVETATMAAPKETATLRRKRKNG